jgi:hypothetical protein
MVIKGALFILSLGLPVLSAGTPTVVSIAPASGGGMLQNFSVRYADSGGAANLTAVYFLVNSSINPARSCMVGYDGVAK